MSVGLIDIIFSILVGLILGLETETRTSVKDEKSKLGGVRTYTMLSLFGGIAGIFYLNNLTIFSVLLFLAVFGLVISAYIWNIKLNGAFGLTTEVAVIITFILGFFATSKIIPLELVLVILVLLLFFLSGKTGITNLVSKIQHQEVVDFIKFGIIALVILPFLPNSDVYLSDLLNYIGLNNALEANSQFNSFLLLNPYSLWFTVVLISGFGLLGYVLSKFIGTTKGSVITGFFAGFISSTAAVISLAAKSKKNSKSTISYVASALLANSSSFIVVGALVLVSSQILFEQTFLFFIILFITGIVCSALLLIKASRNHEVSEDVKYEPFTVIPAIKLVTIILVVRLVIQFLQLSNTDENLIIFFTSLAGLAGIDAPIVAIAGLLNAGNISVEMAVLAVVLINAVNFIAKIVYGFVFGEKKFGWTLGAGLAVSLVVGGLVVVL